MKIVKNLRSYLKNKWKYWGTLYKPNKKYYCYNLLKSISHTTDFQLYSLRYEIKSLLMIIKQELKKIINNIKKLRNNT